MKSFPPFDLKRLMSTVFEPTEGKRLCILIDLENPADVEDFGFLQDESLTIQRHAHDTFYQGFKNGGLEALGMTGGDLFAYPLTGGSNLDMEDEAFDLEGKQLSLEKDIYPNYGIILCISTFSATAPLTAHAKKFGFRGATLHGLNEVILSSGLAVDYNEVSAEAEKLRLALTKSDEFEIDYAVEGSTYTLKIVCDKQDAQKSHGLCRGEKPDVANLPAGEVYFVPTGAEGQFPMRYEDGTLGIMNVSGMRIQNATLLKGDQEVIDAHNHKLKSDPVTGELGELGFGTQELPVSGRDIQDEKIRGTIHVATGRSDHLGGHLTPDLFAEKMNATHDDILFSPTKTPEINIPQVRMVKNGETIVIHENFQITDYLVKALEA
ncbi:MAG: hypothetical protein ACKVJX_21925 [Verrucomicrobiia bacterium]|jgi:aminopeptidase